MAHFYFDFCRACDMRTPHKNGYCVTCVAKALQSDAAAIIFIQRVVEDLNEKEMTEKQREASPEVSREDDSFSNLNPEE